MKCSKCGRRGHSNRQNCLYCGGAFEQEKRSGPLPCCGCKGFMVEVERDGIFIDVCSTCNGIWFDTGELEALIAKAPEPQMESIELTELSDSTTSPHRFQPVRTEYRHCPHCNKMMAQRNYERFSGVMIDMCRFHGIFLDALELEKIQMFVASGGLDKAGAKLAEEKRAADKANVRAMKRTRVNQARSSRFGAHRANHGNTNNAEMEVYSNLFESIGDYFRRVWWSMR